MTDVVSVTLLRHGRSRADDEGVHEGRYDSPLTKAGRQQVHARAEDFGRRGFHFDAIVASPLVRAAESAAIMAQALGGQVELDPDWMEFNNGPLAGLSFTEAESHFPPRPLRSPYETFLETGESRWELYCRAVRALEKVVRRGGSTLVVAHGGILNAALRSITGDTPAGDAQGLVFAFGNTGFVRLRYSPAQNCWALLEFSPE
jgi:2,3-bisphosphoglycerate-dependent phosphoglycerate mutase